jgi:misacylated tRNA(Ala) deacylase
MIHRCPAPGLSVVGAFWRGRTAIAHRRYHRRMTDDLFRADAYLRACEARILRIDDAGIVLDRTVFYPLGGGQAGDAGWLLLADGQRLAIADTRKGKDDEGRPTADICHVPAPGQDTLLAALQPGTPVAAEIDWARRHRMMRLHTTTHLLCHLVAEPVNGCSITPDYARLDFHTARPLDKAVLSAGIAAVMILGRTTAGSSTHGQLYELDAIAAVVVGGTLLVGGRGTITGTVFGVLIFATLTNVFVLNNRSQSEQQLLKGAIIVAAVLLQQRLASRNSST